MKFNKGDLVENIEGLGSNNIHVRGKIIKPNSIDSLQEYWIRLEDGNKIAEYEINLQLITEY